MSNDNLTGLFELADRKDSSVQPALPAHGLEVSKYLPEIADFEITEAQKIELLETLWSIMRSFVELGVNVDFCEQLFQDSEEFPAPQPADVDWLPSASTEKPSDRQRKET